MSAVKRILVTGATGKQGGALVSALLKPASAAATTTAATNPPFHVVALTRNAKSAKAQALSRRYDPKLLSVLEGDLNDIQAIFTKSSQAGGPFHGVFSVQVPLKPRVEEEQGKALVDAAAATGVKHFVYASVERGGPERSDRDATPIKHFISKFNIENHLKQVAGKTTTTTTASEGMQWTIIRPVCFMDNLTPDFLGRAFMAMWRLNGMDTKLQLVSSNDIGLLAAEVFQNPTEYAHQAISLATDELTPGEAKEIFKRVVGTDVPSSYPATARLLKVLLREQLGTMFDWFKEVGFGADPNLFQGKIPGIQNFEAWLRESSGWKNTQTSKP